MDAVIWQIRMELICRITAEFETNKMYHTFRLPLISQLVRMASVPCRVQDLVLDRVKTFRN